MHLTGVHVTILYVSTVSAQKCNGNAVRVETLHELRHTVRSDSSLLITLLSGGIVSTQVQTVCS